MKMRRAIAVFAHNEEAHIIAALESVKACSAPGDRCYVLNNGSRDATAERVREFCADNDFCELVEIAIGDKANAWNVFLYELGIDAETYIFLDGDCEACPNAFNELEKTLASSNSVNAAAAIPSRDCRSSLRQSMLDSGGLSGNLYALSASFVGRIRERNVRFPVGLIGEDSLIGTLSMRNAEAQGSWEVSRTVVSAGAEFRFDRLSPFSWHDLRLYFFRLVRYAIRHQQNEIIKVLMKEEGLAGLRSNFDDIYERYPEMIRVRRHGIDAVFDWLAARLIRKRLAMRQKQGSISSRT